MTHLPPKSPYAHAEPSFPVRLVPSSTGVVAPPEDPTTGEALVSDSPPSPVSASEHSLVPAGDRSSQQVGRVAHRSSDQAPDRRARHGKIGSLPTRRLSRGRLLITVSASLLVALVSGGTGAVASPVAERAADQRSPEAVFSSVREVSGTPSVERIIAPRVSTTTRVSTITRAGHSVFSPSVTLPTPSTALRTWRRSPQPPSATRQLRFSPGSFFYADLRGAPLSADSPALVSHLTRSVTGRYNGVAALNVHDYNVGFYTAAPGTPRSTVRFDDCQNKGWFDPQLARAFADVPIPGGAVAAAGSDQNLSVYDPASDTLWEFWRAQRTSLGWTACFGGRLDSVSTSPGYFPGGLGASATGISMAGGMISLADMKRGYIDHALYLAVPDVRSLSAYSWPAQRSDGWSDDPSSLLEGSRLRLDARVNVDSLPLTPLGRMVAKAAQTYGFVVSDRAGAVAVITESGAATAAANGGVDPWVSLLDLNSKPSYTQLAGFPWERMQVVAKDWGKP